MKSEHILRYLKRASCPKKAIDMARERFHAIEREMAALKSEQLILQAWLAFHDRPYFDKKVEYDEGGYRLFRLEDGETHWISHATRDCAVEFQWQDVLGYKSLEEYEKDIGDYEVFEISPDIGVLVRDDAGGKLEVKTAAEWCQHYGLIASTCI